MIDKIELFSFENFQNSDMKTFLGKSSKTTKLFLQNLVNNTKCTFRMCSMKHVTEFFTHKKFQTENKKEISLSLAEYENWECDSNLKKKTN